MSSDLPKEQVDPQLEACAQEYLAELAETQNFEHHLRLPNLFVRELEADGPSELIALRFSEYYGQLGVCLTHGLGYPPDDKTALFPGQLAYQRILYPPCGVESAQYDFKNAEDLSQLIATKLKSRFEKRALPWFRRNHSIPQPACPEWLDENAKVAASLDKETSKSDTQFLIYSVREFDTDEYLNAVEFGYSVMDKAFPADQMELLRTDCWRILSPDGSHGGEIRIHSHEPMDHYDPIFDVVVLTAHLTADTAAHLERAAEANPFLTQNGDSVNNFLVIISRSNSKDQFDFMLGGCQVSPMPRPRLIIPHQSDGTLPDLAMYHVTSRVVHRQFLFQDEEKEHFRVLMRMYERFSGCRVLSYCVMTNHFHLLLEVPPPPINGEFGISEEELIHRLGGLYSRTYVVGVTTELLEAREIADGKREGFSELSKVDQKKEREYGRTQLAAIFERYTKRMHSLSEFMRGLLQRFTRWFNKRHEMRGTLWEDRFHSVIVQSGFTCRTMTAYIDLNPVRAGICADPANYRWSSYGEAVGGGRGASKAQCGLVCALRGHEGHPGTSRAWAQGELSKEYRKLLLTNATEQSEICSDGKKRVQRKGMNKRTAEKELARLEQEDARDLKIAKVVSCKVRYFKDGAVLGSKEFVNSFFESQRKRFGPKRRDGARRPRGSLKGLAGEIWSLRDLKDG